MENVDLKILKSVLNGCEEVNGSSINVRKLLNLTTKKTLTSIDLEFINNINSDIFLKVYHELYKTNIDDMNIIDDMVIYEYALENVLAADPYEDDEEIY